MAAELQDIAVDFQHLDEVTVATFVVQDISFLKSVDEVHSRFREEIDAHRPAKLIIDFDRVTYLSTAGIRMLLSVLMQVRGYGGELSLCNLSQFIQTTLDIAHLTPIFRIFDDRKGAMAN